MGKNVYVCYNKKYLHESGAQAPISCMSLYTVMKNVIQSIREEFPRKWAASFLLKLEILFKFRMFSGSRLYSFAPRKAKER